MPNLDEPHLHELTVGEVFKHLETREGGLSLEEARQRLSQYGPNVLEEPNRYSLIRGFLCPPGSSGHSRWAPLCC